MADQYIEGKQGVLPGLKRTVRRPLTGAELKDAGARRVLEHQKRIWRASALDALVETARHYAFFTADEYRTVARLMLVGEPHHPNAWAAIIRTGMHDCFIRRTGQTVKSKRPKAHSRMVPVWESLVPGPHDHQLGATPRWLSVVGQGG